MFFVNVPLAGAALIGAFVLIEADQARDGDRRFDLPGVFTATGGITLLVFALVQGPDVGWASPWILAAATAGVVLRSRWATTSPAPSPMSAAPYRTAQSVTIGPTPSRPSTV